MTTFPRDVSVNTGFPVHIPRIHPINIT